MVIQELRRVFRSILQRPAFTTVVLLTVALGVGANTAVFSLIHAVLLEPLPFFEPGRLAQIWETHPELHNFQVSFPDFLDWRQSARDIDLAAYTFQAMNKITLLGQGYPVRVQATMASAGLFPQLGVKPMLGRAFDLREEQHQDRVALISESLWRRKFGADRRIAGRLMRLESQPFTIIGVVRQTHAFPVWADVWIPLSFTEPELQSTRGYHPLEVVGRLGRGVSIERAQTEMETIARRLSAAHPDTNGTVGAFLIPLIDQTTGEARPALLIAWIAVGLVLLIACSNLAHLMMTRSIGQRREVAIRLSLGAGSVAAVRQFLYEGVVLSLCGGGLGLVLAASVLPILRDFARQRIPRLEGTTLDGSVLLFGLLVSLLSGLLFALPACWQAVRADLGQVMKMSGGLGPRRSPASALLMASEVALAVVVMSGAALLVRSFAALLRVDPGFRAPGVLAVDVPLSRDWNKSYELFETRMAPRLRSIPGVEGVAAANSAPMSLGAAERTRFATRFGVAGRSFEPGHYPTAQLRWVTPDDFRVLGIPLKRGRLLAESDHGQPRYLINETLARRFFPDRDPVGQKLILGVVSPDPKPQEIAGVVGDVREFELGSAPEPAMYVIDVSPVMTVLVRGSADPAVITGRIREVDAEIAVGAVRTMDSYVKSSLTRLRFALWLLGTFAGLAALLSAAGIYGVVGYSAGRRLREFGIRSAVGAQRRDLLAMILREALSVAAAGIFAGLCAALWLARFMKSLLFQVRATDVVSHGVVLISVVVLCAVAALIPAGRAAGVNPASALRQE